MSVAALLLAMVITPTSGLAATSRASAQISGIGPDEPVVDGGSVSSGTIAARLGTEC